MVMRKGLTFMLAALAAVPAPALATTVFPQDFTCPIGGEKFQDIVVGSYSSWGSRPDGRRYGTLPWVPLPKCPGNGFLLFKDDFTPEEIAILTPMVESAEYQALRDAETQHYQLWWLMRALPDTDPARLASALLVASWQADGDPARKTRYQQAFIKAAEALPTDSEDWFIYNLRAANARRELGEFDAAEARIAALDAAPEGTPQDPDERAYLEQFITGLRALVAERNAAAEPTNLIPPREAVERCIGDSADLSATERDACATPDHVEAIAEHRARKQANP